MLSHVGIHGGTISRVFELQSEEDLTPGRVPLHNFFGKLLTPMSLRQAV